MMSELFLWVLGLLVVGGSAWLVIYVVRHATVLNATATTLEHELRAFKEGGLDRLINEKLSRLTQQAAQYSAQLVEEERKARSAAEQFKDDLGTVRAELATLKELHAKVGELNDLLKPQQLRGELGEVIIRSLIADKLPRGQYEEDYTFADGKRVEFVIRLNDRLIPVDSKLQLEDYQRMREADDQHRAAFRSEFKRAVKQKIDEVKAYIRPEEGTYEFALMVIPSEAVYYDLIAHRDFLEDGGLYDYARTQRVFLVSPLTFWAYLTAIAHGLRGLEIGRRAEEILTGLQTLATQIRHFSQDTFRILGGHLRNAAGQYEEAHRRLREIEEALTTLERLDDARSEAARDLSLSRV